MIGWIFFVDCVSVFLNEFGRVVITGSIVMVISLVGGRGGRWIVALKVAVFVVV